MMLSHYRLHEEGYHFVLLDIIEDAISVVWTQRWQDYGEAEIRIPLGYDIRINDLMHIMERRMSVLVVSVTETDKEMTLLCTDVLSMLDRRIIYPSVSHDGYLATFFRKILNRYAREFNEDEDALPYELGNIDAITQSATIQRSFKPVGKCLVDISKIYGFSLETELSISGYLKINARVPSATHTWGVGRNVASYTLNSDIQESRNWAYVAAQEGENGLRTVVQVGDDTATWLDRMEMYVDRRDIPVYNIPYDSMVEQYGSITDSVSMTLYTVTQGTSAPYTIVDVSLAGNVYFGDVLSNIRVESLTKDWGGAALDQMIPLMDTSVKRRPYYATWDATNQNWSVTILGTTFTIPMTAVTNGLCKPTYAFIHTMLTSIGEDALAEQQPVDVAEAVLEGLTPYVDYDVGDAVKIFTSSGTSHDGRIVEIVESWDDSGYRATPSFVMD